MKGLPHQTTPNCLKKYRRARGLSQREVARILGLKGTSMISRWEKGVCLPSLPNGLKLAAVYRTLTDVLFVDPVRLLRKELLKREEEAFPHKND